MLPQAKYGATNVVMQSGTCGNDDEGDTHIIKSTNWIILEKGYNF